MNLLAQLFGGRSRLNPSDAERLRHWSARAAVKLNQPFPSARYVVVDVETTGLDLNRDRLIAIGAVAVRGEQIVLSESFEVVLRQDQVSSKDNILIHGIGGEQQRQGLEPAEALLQFLEFLERSPLVAFHVTFDQTMINRAMKEYLGFKFKHPWLDLAYVMPALLPGLAARYRALDEWSGHFQISNYARHSALADALATAQLLLPAIHLATSRRRSRNYLDLQALEEAQRLTNWRR